MQSGKHSAHSCQHAQQATRAAGIAAVGCLLHILQCRNFPADCAGQLLYDLGHAIDNKRVQTKAPQQSIACTKSYHGLREMARVDEALHRLIFALWPRLLEVICLLLSNAWAHLELLFIKPLMASFL